MTEGRPARELTDAELEQQGTHAHATRNWVFLHGTAEQYRRHTERMLELEEEYLRRHPKRTWQGVGGEPVPVDEATRLRLALRSVARQIEALLAEPGEGSAGQGADRGQVRDLLRELARRGGRVHKLELHQLSREFRIDPVSLAALYRGAEPVLATDRDERVLTDAGRDWAGSGS